MPTPAPRCADRRFLAVLLAVALGLRLLYLIESRANPFFDAPIVDAKDYFEQAQRIAGGDWLAGDQPFWQPPLYPYFLALWCALFPCCPFVAIRVAQAILGTISVLLVFDLARLAFGARTARLAAIGAAVYGLSIYFDGELLAVPLEVALNLALVRLVLWALDGGGPRRWLAAGGVAGLAAITRPNILLFAAVLVVWLLVRPRGRPGTGWAQSGVGRAALFAAAAAAAILPVTARNLLVGDDLVLISHNGGVNFYIGNNARYDSTVAIHPGQDWENLVAQPALAGIDKPSGRSRYFVRKSLAYIASQPADYAGLLARKLWLLLNGAEIKRNQDVYYSGHYSRVARLLIWDHGIAFPFGLVAPLALVGLALTWRTPAPAVALLRLYTLSYSASVLLFFVTARYRMPVVPAFLVFAAWTVDWLAGLVRVRAWRRGAAGAAALVVLTVLLNQEHASRPEQDAQLFHDLGEAHLRQQQYGPAIANLERAIALEPHYSSALHNLAVAHLEQGRYAEAEAAAREALRWHAPRADTRAVLARVYMLTGDLPKAEAEIRRSLELDPGRAATHHQYAELLMRQQRWAEAVGQMEQARGPATDWWVTYDLGRALHGAGRLEAALEQFELACRLAPQRPEGWVAAGAVLLATKDLAGARQRLERALALAPSDAAALGNLGLVELAAGRPQRAAELLARAIALAPNAGGLRAALAVAERQAGVESGPQPRQDTRRPLDTAPEPQGLSRLRR